MNNKMTKPAAAAIILVVGILGLTLFEKTVPTVYAVEQTIEAMRSVNNLRLKTEVDGHRITMIMVINQQNGRAEHIRMEADSGDVTITTPGQTYVYKSQKNEVTLLGQELLVNNLNFHDVINSLIEQTHRLLIDPESHLPIYLGMEAGDKLNYMGPIEYNIDIAEDAFVFVIPEGAKVNDQRPEELKAQPVQLPAAVDFNILETVAALQTAHNGHGILIDRQGRRVEIWAEINPITGMMSKARLEYEDGGLYIMA
ncbi:MAG: hypothetical protein ACYTER_01675, partial [Planctomycetota bacterium]